MKDYTALAEHALRNQADIDDEIGTALMLIDVRKAIEQAVSEHRTEGAAPNEVWMVSSKTVTILFKSHDTALAYVAQFGASASGGMSITKVPVFE